MLTFEYKRLTLNLTLQHVLNFGAASCELIPGTLVDLFFPCWKPG